VEAVRNELKENSAHADPKLLKDYLLLCWRKKAEWGTEWKGHFHPKWILWALEVGPGTSEEDHIRKLLRYKKDILVSFYHILYHMKKDERISFFEKARTEYDSEVKTSKVDFAKKQAKILQQMGLTTKTAWKIIRTVGPSNAVQTYNWIISIQKSHPRAFLYTHLSQIAKRAKGIYSWGLLNKQFEKHNIETPPGSYQQIFKHLRLAQELGFIHQDLQIHRPN
jgi:hypothetical protein